MQSASELSADLSRRAEAFCRSYLPNGQLAGNYWKIGDTSGSAGQSLQVRLIEMYGKPAGRWTDYATGEYGDLLDMIAHVRGISDFSEIANEARSFLGQPEVQRISPTTPLPRLGPSDNITKAKRLLSIAKPIAGTLAEAYLKNRGISRFGEALAFHEGVYYRPLGGGPMSPEPAMLAAITDNAGKTTGVARTWLDPNYQSLSSLEDPKRVMGRLYGNAVRFGRKDTVLACGEGIETMLSVGSVLTKLPIAACLTATHLGLFEVPDHVEEIWIFRDLDEAGQRAAETLTQKGEAEGRRIVVHEPILGDFNDDLQRFGRKVMLARMEDVFGHVVHAFV